MRAPSLIHEQNPQQVFGFALAEVNLEKRTDSMDPFGNLIEPDNGNVHRAAGEIIASKNRGAGGSVCNVLLSRRPSAAIHAASSPRGIVNVGQ